MYPYRFHGNSEMVTPEPNFEDSASQKPGSWIFASLAEAVVAIKGLVPIREMKRITVLARQIGGDE